MRRVTLGFLVCACLGAVVSGQQPSPIKAGLFADLIAVPGNPLDDVDALKNVFVMKDGQVFKKDGEMTPAAFFHGGPVNGWRIR